MNKLKKVLNLTIGIAIMGGLLYGFWQLLSFVWRTFSGLPTEYVPAIVTAVTTFLVSLITITLGKYLERKMIIDKEMREKKIPVYNELIDFIFELMANPGSKSVDEMNNFIKEFTKKILVWGSDDIIVQWSNYRNSAKKIESSKDPYVVLKELEKLLLAIRKDVGHKNKNLKEGVLLSMFIKDK
ncbi:hypothetical protein [Brevibacillus marinus]|jgi:hypothetical protein|uniref:hypothetical protein n=1 Tax=Brevibacillus marinus TaxID=2496837 RepID=UPI000F845FB0|nr:hypothetical protein [Brevibacillus marinus]